MQAGRDPVSSQSAAVWMLVLAAAILPTELGSGHAAASDVATVLGAALAAVAASAVVLAWRPRASVVIVTAALCTAGAAAIHFAVTNEHFREWWGFGLFFLCAAWAQLVWAAAVVRVRSHPLLVVGLVGNLGVVLLWLVTRTAGLPFGPDPGEVEAFGWADGISSAFEVWAACCCAFVLARPVVAARVRIAPLLVALPTATLTAVGVADAVSGHAH